MAALSEWRDDWLAALDSSSMATCTIATLCAISSSRSRPSSPTSARHCSSTAWKQATSAVCVCVHTVESRSDDEASCEDVRRAAVMSRGWEAAGAARMAATSARPCRTPSCTMCENVGSACAQICGCTAITATTAGASSISCSAAMAASATSALCRLKAMVSRPRHVVQQARNSACACSGGR